MKKLAIIIVSILFIIVFFCGCTNTQNIGISDENEENAEENIEEESSPDTSYFYKRLGEFCFYIEPEVWFTVKQIKTTIDYVEVLDAGYIYVDKPSESDYGYFWVYFSAENRDNVMADSPSTYWLRLLVSGTEMSEDTPSYSMSGLYNSYSKINPGAKNEGWIIYSIPKNARNVQFIFEFSNGYGIWNISNSEIVFQERNFNNLADGQSITFGSEQDFYELSISHDKTVKSYSYKSSYSDNVYTKEASSGYKFVFITVIAKNMGTRKIDVPSSYDIILIADGKQYSKEGYYGENSYQDISGTLYPGVTGEGSIVFEVPDSITSATIFVELASGVEAFWLISI